VVGSDPFFSPDGQWLAFFSSDGLQRIPAGGGAIETITPEVAGNTRTFGGSWGRDGTIVVSSGGTLLRVSASGGKTQVLAAPDMVAGKVRYAWPEFLPDGRSVLFTVLPESGPADARIAVIDLMTRQQKTVVHSGHSARYIPTGHLLYAGGGGLQAVRFDLESLESGGVPTRVDGVAIAQTLGGFTANFDVSATGTLAYLPLRAPATRSIVWVDRRGREEPIAAPPMDYIYPRISPDGTRMALDVGGGNRDIWMWHFARPGITRITHGPTEDLMPAWSTDGTRVFFASDREGGAFRVFSVAADGAGGEKQEFAGATNFMPLSMPAPDQLLVAASGPAIRGGDVAVLTLGQGAQSRGLLAKDGVQGNAQVSPDGRWIAYQSSESGDTEVYVRPYPDVERRREQISHGGGLQPLWGKAGSGELFYWTAQGALKVVSLTLTPELKVGATQDIPLADHYDPPINGSAWRYQVSPVDGRLLLFTRSAGADTVTPIKVVVNWVEELKRLVPSP
jgi:serine/threonine-protein kinase